MDIHNCGVCPLWHSIFMTRFHTQLTFYRSLDAAVLDFSNRSEIRPAPRQQGCRDACQISERYDHCNIKSRGLETSRDLAVRETLAMTVCSGQLLPLPAWFEACVPTLTTNKYDSVYMLLNSNQLPTRKFYTTIDTCILPVISGNLWHHAVRNQY